MRVLVTQTIGAGSFGLKNRGLNYQNRVLGMLLHKASRTAKDPREHISTPRPKSNPGIKRAPFLG